MKLTAITIFTGLIMLIKFWVSFFVFAFSLFSDELTEINISDYDNTVFIIAGNLYCSDCLKELSNNQKIWNDKFSSVLVTTSEKNKKSILIKSKSLKKLFKFDDIVFIEQSRRNLVQYFIFEGNKILHSPALLIRKNGINNFIDYKELFKNDTIDLSTRLKEIFKKL